MTVTDETTTVDVHAVGTRHRIVFPNTEYHGFAEGDEVTVQGPGPADVYRRCTNDSGTAWNVHVDHLQPIGLVPEIGGEYEVVGHNPYSTPFEDGDIVRVTAMSSLNTPPYVRCDRIAPTESFGWNLRFTDLRLKAADVPEPEPESPDEVLALMDPDEPWHGKRRALRSVIEERDRLQQALDEERATRGEWSARLIERSHEVANSNEDGRWCEVFDDGMEMLGLPTRGEAEPDTEMVTVWATANISFAPDEGDIRNMIERCDGRPGEVTYVDDDFTIRMDIEVSTEVEVTEGSCACDADIDWDEVVPSWATEGQFTYEAIESERCDND